MKKFLMAIAISTMMLFATACNNNENVEKNTNNTNNNTSKLSTLTCTKTESDDGVEMIDTIEIQHKDNIVKKVDNTTVTQIDSEYMDFSLELMNAIAEKFNNIKGMNYKVSKKDDSHIESVISVDYDNIDIDKLNEVASELSDDDSDNSSFISSIKSKTLTLDEYKSQNLDGYDCK